jgi:hypothetical protein
LEEGRGTDDGRWGKKSLWVQGGGLGCDFRWERRHGPTFSTPQLQTTPIQLVPFETHQN